MSGFGKGQVMELLSGAGGAIGARIIDNKVKEFASTNSSLSSFQYVGPVGTFLIAWVAQKYLKNSFVHNAAKVAQYVAVADLLTQVVPGLGEIPALQGSIQPDSWAAVAGMIDRPQTTLQGPGQPESGIWDRSDYSEISY